MCLANCAHYNKELAAPEGKGLVPLPFKLVSQPVPAASASASPAHPHYMCLSGLICTSARRRSCLARDFCSPPPVLRADSSLLLLCHLHSSPEGGSGCMVALDLLHHLPVLDF